MGRRKESDGRTFNITGAADASVPGWEERVLAAVRKSQGRSNRWTDRRNGTLLAYDDPFRVLLNEAAKRRGISMSGYCRRAVAAFIARDLGISLERVVSYTAAPAPYGTGAGGRLRKTQDSGQGFGPWVIGKVHE